MLPIVLHSVSDPDPDQNQNFYEKMVKMYNCNYFFYYQKPGNMTFNPYKERPGSLNKIFFHFFLFFRGQFWLASLDLDPLLL